MPINTDDESDDDDEDWVPTFNSHAAGYVSAIRMHDRPPTDRDVSMRCRPAYSKRGRHRNGLYLHGHFVLAQLIDAVSVVRPRDNMQHVTQSMPINTDDESDDATDAEDWVPTFNSRAAGYVSAIRMHDRPPTS